MPRRSEQKLTQATVAGFEPPPKGDFTVFDSDLPGFGVRVWWTGTKTFVAMYRNANGRLRRYSLGKYGKLTVSEARKEAMAILGDASKGQDPLTTKLEKRKQMSVAELCDQYLADADAGRISYRGKVKQPVTIYMDRGRINRHIKPLIGHRSITELSRAHVEKMMFDIRDGKTAKTEKTKPRGKARITGGQGTATMAVKLVSAICNYAIRKELMDRNPAQGIERPADGKRTRFLNQDEYGRLGEAIIGAAQQGINLIALNAIKGLALTGCRRGEILSLEREAVSIEAHGLQFHKTKTGAQLRPCGQLALDHFTTVMAGHSSSWVFPRVGSEGPLVNIRKPMTVVCDLAGFDDVTPHTLRHAYATVAHELGYSELTIAGLLGHSAHSVTSRYAHHVDSALASAADEVSATIGQRMRLV